MIRLLLFVCLLWTAQPTSASDWPQILGPDRNAVVAEAPPNFGWSGESPKVLWRTPAGSGVAGAAIVEGTAYLFFRVEDEEVLEARELKSGQLQWTQKFPTNYQPRIMPDDGPLCVPTISGDRIVLFGASGGLRCLERKTGKVLWSRDALEDYGADEGYFGAGSSPLITENLVLVNVGGFRDNAGVVAFDLKSGQTVWQTGAWQPSYSAPILTQVNGTPIAIFCTRLDTVGLNPKTGEVLFQTPFGARGPTVNGATPVVRGDHLFLTASYNIGSVWARFNDKSIEIERTGLDPMASQYTTPVPVGTSLIGCDGRQDGPDADLVCFDPATGDVRWRETGFGYATLIRVGNQLLIVKTDGELVLAKASEERLQILQRTSVLDGVTRALPALSGNVLVVRNEQEWICLQLVADK
ncbi:outer membrane protein assembly factor BamB family protein [Rubinisphaera margarita]|uniref:outer membrane protein assembly factor BamB family protein n=1 Tax=Rubinisphaera margarita TaxID=2909586 RepID=UPI001EE8FD29|nr:PQQ-binding-like beta-propeller repeat protein [Rubinisphaera margarita]MCG6155550.1 PQQ-like beta-propeller repeat protein [Rubinisphaera margarita]